MNIKRKSLTPDQIAILEKTRQELKEISKRLEEMPTLYEGTRKNTEKTSPNTNKTLDKPTSSSKTSSQKKSKEEEEQSKKEQPGDKNKQSTKVETPKGGTSKKVIVDPTLLVGSNGVKGHTKTTNSTSTNTNKTLDKPTSSSKTSSQKKSKEEEEQSKKEQPGDKNKSLEFKKWLIELFVKVGAETAVKLLKYKKAIFTFATYLLVGRSCLSAGCDGVYEQFFDQDGSLKPVAEMVKPAPRRVLEITHVCSDFRDPDSEKACKLGDKYDDVVRVAELMGIKSEKNQKWLAGEGNVKYLLAWLARIHFGDVRGPGGNIHLRHYLGKKQCSTSGLVSSYDDLNQFPGRVEKERSDPAWLGVNLYGSLNEANLGWVVGSEEEKTEKRCSAYLEGSEKPTLYQINPTRADQLVEWLRSDVISLLDANLIGSRDPLKNALRFLNGIVLSKAREQGFIIPKNSVRFAKVGVKEVENLDWVATLTPKDRNKIIKYLVGAALFKVVVGKEDAFMTALRNSQGSISDRLGKLEPKLLREGILTDSVSLGDRAIMYFVETYNLNEIYENILRTNEWIVRILVTLEQKGATILDAKKLIDYIRLNKNDVDYYCEKEGLEILIQKGLIEFDQVVKKTAKKKTTLTKRRLNYQREVRFIYMPENILAATTYDISKHFRGVRSKRTIVLDIPAREFGKYVRLTLTMPVSVYRRLYNADLQTPQTYQNIIPSSVLGQIRRHVYAKTGKRILLSNRILVRAIKQK